ncbi:hypothetical protein, partial [Motilimonas pumila]
MLLSLLQSSSTKRRQLGAAISEYLPVIGLVVVVAIVAFQMFGSTVRDQSSEITSEMAGIPSPFDESGPQGGYQQGGQAGSSSGGSHGGGNNNSSSGSGSQVEPPENPWQDGVHAGDINPGNNGSGGGDG